MKKKALLIFVLLTYYSTHSQLKIAHTEKLPLGTSHIWGNPKFSPDGKTIYFSTFDYQGIWSYSLTSRKMKKITNDPRSGYEFAISPDEKQIAYRRTLREGSPKTEQEIVVKDLATESATVLESGAVLSTPAFVGSTVVYSVGSRNVETKNLRATAVASKPVVIGIENTKISLAVNGSKRLLDPLKNGSYIWPMLSPDGKKLVASDMSKGTFVCDLKGNVLAKLGKRNAAVWTRDGKWLVYMSDKDDGHNIISSDLLAISSDGRRVSQLTFTKDEIEMYPQCSPVENKIVCSTLDGKIVMMTFEEAKR